MHFVISQFMYEIYWTLVFTSKMSKSTISQTENISFRLGGDVQMNIISEWIIVDLKSQDKCIQDTWKD